MDIQKYKLLLERAIEEIEFEKIVVTMRFLEWKWACWNQFDAIIEYRYPTIAEMKDTIRQLFDSAVELIQEENAIYPRIGTGGFVVEVDTQQETVSVEFVVEEGYSHREDSFKQSDSLSAQ